MVTYQSKAGLFRVYDVETKSMLAKFDKPQENFAVSNIALSRAANTLAFTQG